MKHYRISTPLLGYDLIAEGQLIGADWHLRITGGSAPHIGAVSLVWHENQEIVVKSIVRPNHKDYIIGELFGRAVAKATNKAVSVEAGVHYDGIDKEEIAGIVASSEILIANFIELLD